MKLSAHLRITIVKQRTTWLRRATMSLNSAKEPIALPIVTVTQTSVETMVFARNVRAVAIVPSMKDAMS